MSSVGNLQLYVPRTSLTRPPLPVLEESLSYEHSVGS